MIHTAKMFARWAAYRIAVALMFATAANMLTSCSKEKPPQLTDPKDVEVIASGEVGRFSTPLVYEGGVGIRAIADADGSIVISLENRLERPLPVAPRDFALITGPDRARDLVLISPATADLRMFAPETVRSMWHAVFRLKMTKISCATGMRVVYQNPALKLKFFVTVE